MTNQKKVMLFLKNQENQLFLVHPHKGLISKSRGNWCLPIKKISGNPNDILAIAQDLAYSYFRIKIEIDNLIVYFVDLPSGVCVVTNKEADPEINSLFKKVKEGYGGYFTLLHVDHASSQESSFDSYQRDILEDSGLFLLQDTVHERSSHEGDNVFCMETYL